VQPKPHVPLSSTMDEILWMNFFDNFMDALYFILNFHPIESIKQIILHQYSAIEHG
jgi:hypothetical protein